jgi:uncharacterized membrane protein
MVTFLPFSNAVLGNYVRARTAAVLYGSNLLVAGVLLLAHWMYASGGRRLVHAEVADGVIASVLTRG